MVIYLTIAKFLNGMPGGNRTPDTKFRKLVLYPTELRAHNIIILFYIQKKAVRLCFYGGEGGIRTHGTLTRTLVFKTSALNQARPPLHVKLSTKDIIAY